MGTFTTKIKLGSIGYVVICNYNDYTFLVKEMEVGKVEIELFHPKANTSGKPIYTEKYMCFETGVGSGTVYTYGTHIFSTRKDAENIGIVKQKQRVYKEIYEQAKRKKEREDYEAEQELMQFKRLKSKYESITQ